MGTEPLTTGGYYIKILKEIVEGVPSLRRIWQKRATINLNDAIIITKDQTTV